MSTDNPEAPAEKTPVAKKAPAVKKTPVKTTAAVKPVANLETKKNKTEVAAEKPKAIVAEKPKKAPKLKTIHDCFEMPQTEFSKIAVIKQACLAAGLKVKKNDVIRGGLKALSEMNPEQLARAMSGLGKVKKST